MFDPIPLPAGLRLDTARAENVLLALRPQDLGPRHWLALVRIAAQHPDAPPDSDRLPIDVTGIAPQTLRDLAGNIVIKQMEGGNWGILPGRLHNVRQALAALAEDNAGRAGFVESPADHARRLHSRVSQMTPLRQRLLDLRAGVTARRANWTWDVMEFTADDLMRVLRVRPQPAWFGTALAPGDVTIQPNLAKVQNLPAIEPGFAESRRFADKLALKPSQG